MAHDRIDGDELPLVHEFLALMLGVRRAGVTVALHRHERLGLIEVARRRIKVLDRAGLTEIANGSYGVPEAEYARLMKRQIKDMKRSQPSTGANFSPSELRGG